MAISGGYQEETAKKSPQRRIPQEDQQLFLQEGNCKNNCKRRAVTAPSEEEEESRPEGSSR